jgi:nucleoside-diphosphate-sugar epimerase
MREQMTRERSIDGGALRTSERRVVITGGSGFIGTNLVEHYRRAGWEVVNADVAPPRNPDHASYWRKLDILDGTAFRDLVRGVHPTVFVHLAARTDLRGATAADYAANIDGVRNAIGAARASTNIEAAIFASSMLVCALGYQPRRDDDYCPTTAYGRSKVEGETIVRREAGDALPWLIVRPTSIWGPWFAEPYRDFFTAIQRGLYMHPRGVRVRRSYGFVYNSVFILDRLTQHARGAAHRRTFYVADYEPVELRRWAEWIRAALQAPRIRDVPLPLLRAGARVGDALKMAGLRNPPLSSFRLNNLLTDAVYDLEPTRELCGPLPCSTADGIAATATWMRNHRQ